MTWIQLDDRFFSNPKVRTVGLYGRALYIAALCHCSRHETDGWVAGSVVALLHAEAEVPAAKQRATVAALVAAGLWLRDDVGDGWQVHDYLEHQRSKADMDRARAQSRATTAAWRRAKAERRDTTGDASVTCHPLSHGDTGDRGGDTDVTSSEAEAEAEAEAERVTSSDGSSSAAVHVLPNELKTNRRPHARKAAM